MKVSNERIKFSGMENKKKSQFKASYYDKLTTHREKIYSSLFDQSKSILLGLGCANGSFTLKIARKIKVKINIGIDLDDEALLKANNKGILAIKADLNSAFPLSDESVDIISSDQVIEHLTDVDNFVKEIFRILKPSGYAIVSTENLSSWHNIFAIILGKQAFSQQISSKYHLGNPFSLHYKEPITAFFPHIHIFTIQGLKDIFETYGFDVEKVRGMGYFPFPCQLGKLLEVIDPTHSYFLAIKVRKPENK